MIHWIKSFYNLLPLIVLQKIKLFVTERNKVIETFYFTLKTFVKL